MADRIKLFYVAVMALAYGVYVVCWALTGAQVDRIRAAQNAQSLENAQQIQQLKDKVAEHDLKIAVDESSQDRLWQKLNAMELSLVTIQTKLDGISTVMWSLIVPITVLAVKEIMALVAKAKRNPQ